MTVRAAKFGDISAMLGLLHHQHSRSIYADAGVIDDNYTRKLLAQLVQRHAGTTNGASCVYIAEDADGHPAALIVGILDRVYSIGSKFVANDLFLVAGPTAPATALLKLIAAYIKWAVANPKVHEIRLSYTDSLPEGERMGPIYERLGFKQCGSIYRREIGASGAEVE
jgi:hypothetical protein